MSWEIYKGDARIGTIDGNGKVFIGDTQVGYATNRGDVYDRTMTKRGVIRSDGDVLQRGTTLVGNVSPSGDIYQETVPAGRVLAKDGADSSLSVFQAGGAALLLW